MIWPRRRVRALDDRSGQRGRGSGSADDGTERPDGAGQPERDTGPDDDGTGQPERDTGPDDEGTGQPERDTGPDDEGTGQPERGAGRRSLPTRLIVEAAAASLLAGLLVAALWPRLAPDVVLVVVDGEPRLGEQAGLHVFDQDAWFGVLALVAGLLLGGTLWHRHGERHPVATPVVLVVAGLAGSPVAWQVGGLLGPQLPATAGLEDLVEVTAPLDLHAYGVLLLWPLASVIVVLLGALLAADPPATPTPTPPAPVDHGEEHLKPRS